MATNTTNIHELPLNPAVNGVANENVSFVATEKQSPSGMTLDQTTINQLVSGLQQASIAGVTQLPNRDIPRSTESVTQDTQVIPNYIPPPPKKKVNFIKEQETTEEIVEKYISSEKMETSLDSIYDELQTPLLLTVLYFIFQLPVVRKQLFHYIPFLFSKDGNINLNGLAFMSIMFGSTFYFVSKSITTLNNTI